MASAWAQLSSEEKKSYEDMGYVKQSYNEKFGKGGETPPPVSSSSSPSNQVAAKETAQTVLNADNTSGSSDLFPDGTSRPATSSSSSSGSQDRTETIAKERELATAAGTADNNSTEAVKPPTNYLDTNFSELDPAYRVSQINEYGTKEDAKAAHKEARKNAGTYTNQRLESYNVDNIEDFDPTQTGIGYKDNENRLNVTEIENLRDKGGFSEQEIYDYAMTGGAADAERGDKAQDLLDSFKSDLITEPDLPGITQPGGGGEDTLPGGGEDTLPGGGEDTLPGGGEDTLPGGGNDTLPGGGSTIIENVQDVNVDQRNEQTFNNNINNEFNQSITGNNNTVDNAINNSVSNYGGDQENASTVTQGSGQQAQDLLGSYVDDLSGAGQTTVEATQPSGSSGFRRGQDLMNPNYFMNKQEADIDQGNEQSFNNNINNNFTQNVSGDGNFIDNDIDNSVRNYGGDQRNFSYVSNNSNPYTDTPASMATLAGYNSVSDSPGSNAAFVDQYQTLNRDAQKQYDGVGLANEMIYRGNSVAPFDPAALDAAIQARPQTARDRAAVGFGNVFGDIANFPTFNFEMPPPPERADEFDPDEAFDRYTDY